MYNRKTKYRKQRTLLEQIHFLPDGQGDRERARKHVLYILWECILKVTDPNRV